MTRSVATNGKAPSPADLSANPLLAAPAEFRPAVSKLWALNQHMLASPLPLAARVRQWSDDIGLTLADFQAVCVKLCEPERQAAHANCPAFMADIAALVAVVVKRREAREASRKEIDGVRSEPIDPAVRDALKRSGLLGEGRAG